MVFDMLNETDVQMLASMIRAFRDERIEFVIERDCTFELGADRSRIKLIV